MKGIIFTNFCSMVEQQFGERMLDDILEEAAPESGGAYTSLGDYPHSELLDLVACLSRRSGVEADTLVHAFGGYLIEVFRQQFSAYFDRAPDAFSFLIMVPDVIHREVRKLYDHAIPPGFEYHRESPDQLVLIYSSARPLATLARGMIEACCRHYGEEIRVEHTALPDGRSHRFDLHKALRKI